MILIIYDKIKLCCNFLTLKITFIQTEAAWRCSSTKPRDLTNGPYRYTNWNWGVPITFWIHEKNISGFWNRGRTSQVKYRIAKLIGRARFIVINWRKLGQYYFRNAWYAYVRVVITVLLLLQYARYTIYFSEKVVDRKISWRTKWQKVRAWHTLQVKATTRRSNTLSCHGL